VSVLKKKWDLSAFQQQVQHQFLVFIFFFVFIDIPAFGYHTCTLMPGLQSRREKNIHGNGALRWILGFFARSTPHPGYLNLHLCLT
jgi:hypothetical protein